MALVRQALPALWEVSAPYPQPFVKPSPLLEGPVELAVVLGPLAAGLQVHLLGTAEMAGIQVRQVPGAAEAEVGVVMQVEAHAVLLAVMLVVVVVVVLAGPVVMALVQGQIQILVAVAAVLLERGPMERRILVAMVGADLEPQQRAVKLTEQLALQVAPPRQLSMERWLIIC